VVRPIYAEIDEQEPYGPDPKRATVQVRASQAGAAPLCLPLYNLSPKPLLLTRVRVWRVRTTLGACLLCTHRLVVVRPINAEIDELEP